MNYAFVKISKRTHGDVVDMRGAHHLAGDSVDALLGQNSVQRAGSVATGTKSSTTQIRSH